MKAIRCTNGECDFVHNGVCCNDLIKKSTECKSHNQRMKYKSKGDTHALDIRTLNR